MMTLAWGGVATQKVVKEWRCLPHLGEKKRDFFAARLSCETNSRLSHQVRGKRKGRKEMSSERRQLKKWNRGLLDVGSHD